MLKQVLYEISKENKYNLRRIDGIDGIQKKRKTTGNIDKDKIVYKQALDEANEIIKKIKKKYLDQITFLKEQKLYLNLSKKVNKDKLNEIEKDNGCDKILILDGSHAYLIAETGN